ncbi:MAG: hypothetical protein N7Q72_05190, partial [Spiroplasma sp. Tabriz.8]|nr:hypothetical protein [Spiroplasma sp. Tabriz.8]
RNEDLPNCNQFIYITIYLLTAINARKTKICSFKIDILDKLYNNNNNNNNNKYPDYIGGPFLW